MEDGLEERFVAEDDGGLGLRAIKMLTDDARKLAEGLNPQDRSAILFEILK